MIVVRVSRVDGFGEVFVAVCCGGDVMRLLWGGWG